MIRSQQYINTQKARVPEPKTKTGSNPTGLRRLLHSATRTLARLILGQAQTDILSVIWGIPPLPFDCVAISSCETCVSVLEACSSILIVRPAALWPIGQSSKKELLQARAAVLEAKLAGG